MKGSISVQEEETWTAPPAKARRAPARKQWNGIGRKGRETIERRGDEVR